MRPRAPLLAILPLLLAVGCVDADRPATCGEDAATLEITVRADGMEPNPAEACEGQAVQLVVTSEVDGVFHIHGYDHAVSATTIAAGQETVLDFTADRTGQFPVELHPADDPRGVDIGIFTVHER